MPRKSKDLEAYYVQTLAQSVAEKEQGISDYACNIFADKLAQIDILLDLFSEDKKFTEKLKILRSIYRKIGTALWFMHAGELTNLGARLGSEIRHHRVRE